MQNFYLFFNFVSFFRKHQQFFFYYYLLFSWWKTCAINKNLHASNSTTTTTALGTGFSLLLLLLVNEFFIFTNITNLAWVAVWVSTVFAVLVFNEQVILFLYLFTILVALVFYCTMQTDNVQQQQQQWQQQKSCCLCNRQQQQQEETHTATQLRMTSQLYSDYETVLSFEV